MIICGCICSYGNVQGPPCDPKRTPLGCTRHLRKLSRDPMRAFNDPLEPTTAVHGTILGPEKFDFPAMRSTFNFCEDFDLFLERGMSKDHPATPQGLPSTPRGSPRTLRELPKTPAGTSKDNPVTPQGPSRAPLGCTRDLRDSSKVHQRPPMTPKGPH